MSGPAESSQKASTAQDVRALASEWLERRVSEDWSDKDQAELDAWVAESATNKVAYMRVSAAWAKADRIVVLKTPSFRPAAPAQRKGIVSTSFQIAAALIVASAIGIGTTQYLSRPDGTVYSTAVGGHKTITLSDGSRIELNTDTSLRIALKDDRRNIVLDKGEAFFHVTHDSSRPFVVTVGSHRITDIGTEFVVRRQPGEVKVSLVEGRAQFENIGTTGSKPAVLAPGDVVVATSKDFSVTRKPVHDLDETMAWRHGSLIFFHTSLADAAKEINRYNEQKVVVADTHAARLKINGTFPVNDVRLFGRVAHVVLGVNVENKGGDVVISR